MAEPEGRAVQLIDASANLRTASLDGFSRRTMLAERGLSYGVVSIIGPQSSGKSTLMNHLFGTNFMMMDASRGRGGTTKGIWIAKASDFEPFTVVIDLEGSDGRERGEDDTSFEKKSAVFALAISDIVMINLWSHDVSREHGACKPLLRVALQTILHLTHPHKTTLLVVLRDAKQTVSSHMEDDIYEDINEIWGCLSKPQEWESGCFHEFFNVEVMGLTSYEYQENEFEQEVKSMGEWVSSQLSVSVAHKLQAGNEHDIPGSAFLSVLKKRWKEICEFSDLSQPSQRILVAEFKCDRIIEDKLDLVASDEEYIQLMNNVKSSMINNFKEKLESIFGLYLSQYDGDTIYIDDDIRSGKRQEFISAISEVLKPAIFLMFGHLYCEVLEKFAAGFTESLKKTENYDLSLRIWTENCLVELNKRYADIAPKWASCDKSPMEAVFLQMINHYGEKINEAHKRGTTLNYSKLVKPLLRFVAAVLPEIADKFSSMKKDSPFVKIFAALMEEIISSQFD